MRAVGFFEAGGPDVLQVVDLPDPVPGPGQVLLRVHAAAVSPTDTVRRSGSRKWEKDQPNVPGMDAAGIVAAIGPDTETDLQVGDAAMAIVVPDGPYGAYSELIALPAESIVRAPSNVAHDEASTLPMNGLTARLALDTLALEPGQVLAVTGSAGTLGGYVIELARADGLTVIADAAPKDHDLVASFGADHIVPRGDDFTDRVRGIVPVGADGVVDAAVQEEIITGAVKDGGTIITIRYFDKEAERGVMFTSISVVDYAEERAKLDTLRQQVEDGTLTLRVAQCLPKEEAGRAHKMLEGGGIRGRLVLRF